MDPYRLPTRLQRFDIDSGSGCWLWSGPLNRKGYGRVDLHGQQHLAHRAVYEYVNGEIDHAIPLHHMCDSPSCVNPDHMIPLEQCEHLRVHRDKRNGKATQRLEVVGTWQI